jgi:agmatinase
MVNQYTFAGLPKCKKNAPLSADIAIIGIPHGVSYFKGIPSHSEKAPNAIRKAAKRYAKMIEHYDYDLGGSLLNNSDIRIVDCGDVPGDFSDPIGNHRRSQEKIQDIIVAGAIPIVLGGDDSVTIPFLRAFQGHGLFTVVQVDAHIDWRHEINGITEGPSSAMRRASEMPWIDKLIQVGMRGVGSARIQEIEAAKVYGANIITAKKVYESGINQVLKLVPDGSTCLLTLDCDGLDPSIMPGVKAPMPGGLSYLQVVDILHGIVRKGNVCGFNLVEFMPEKDINGLTALTAARIVFNMIGALVRSTFFAQRRI